MRPDVMVLDTQTGRWTRSRPEDDCRRADAWRSTLTPDEIDRAVDVLGTGADAKPESCDG